MKIRVIVNCAMSADGKIALPNRSQIRISSEEDIKRVHELRNSVDAILVGIGTVLNDDPKLTVKKEYVAEMHHPIRVVLDSSCRTPLDALVVNNTSKTLIMVAKENERETSFPEHVEIVPCEKNDQGELDVNHVLEQLRIRGIQSVLIEGGSDIIWSFLYANVVDELMMYIGPVVIGGKNTPTPAGGYGARNESECIPLILVSAERLGSGILLRYVRK